MFKKAKNVALVAGVLAAISFGGTALTSAGAAPAHPAKGGTSTAVQRQKTEAGARTAVAAATTQADEANDAERADGSGPTGTTGDGETADGSGSADQETNDGPETGAEVSENDGPGGHADEPGNPNAEHEASGQE
jgi:hypothetical protein